MKNLVSSIASTYDKDVTMAATTLCSMKLDDPVLVAAKSQQPLLKEKQLGVKHTKIRKITFRLQEETYVIQDPQPQSTLLQIPSAKTKMAKKKINGELSMELKNFISNSGGSEAVLVVEKRLTKTDVNPSQGRLLKVENPDFVTEAENEQLKGKKDIKVLVFDPQLDKYALNLASWKMNSADYFVLKTNWNLVVAKNRLEENMVVQVWSFRIDQQLCFALVNVAN